MKVTKDGFKDRQLHIEDYLQMVSAEQKEYAEVSAHQRIAENNDIITDFQTDNLMEQILHKDNLNKAYKKVKSNKGAGGVDGMSVDDDDDKIRLNQRKPSKYKGLRRFGPEKNLQRINKFMKERPIFYKNLIQMKENIRFYLRCFYCITKVMILQFNSENRTELARNG